MTIERVVNHGIAYLRLTASLGLKKVGGRVVQRRKVVLSLGPMSRHDDGKPDYLRRLREAYKAGKPLIKELEPSVDGAAKGRVTVTFNAGDPTSSAARAGPARAARPSSTARGGACWAAGRCRGTRRRRSGSVPCAWRAGS